MKVKVGYKEMVRRAEANVRTVSVDEALKLHGKDDVVFVDLRDVRELYRDGKVAGARHIPRGMLEFWIDPDSPYHKPLFSEDKTFVFYCNLGWRSALAADVAQQMGLEKVCHIEGGYEGWKTSGGPVEEVAKR